MKRELIFTFCCLLTTLVWSQEGFYFWEKDRCGSAMV